MVIVHVVCSVDAAGSKLSAVLGERDQERARAERLDAIAQERERTVEMLKSELIQVRKDKDAEIARLVATKSQA